MKILVLDNYENFTLVPQLREALPSHEVIKMGNIHTDHLWGVLCRIAPDVIFVDFCDKNAVVLTQRIKTLPRQPKVVIRLHGYEAHW